MYNNLIDNLSTDAWISIRYPECRKENMSEGYSSYLDKLEEDYATMAPENDSRYEHRTNLFKVWQKYKPEYPAMMKQQGRYHNINHSKIGTFTMKRNKMSRYWRKHAAKYDPKWLVEPQDQAVIDHDLTSMFNATFDDLLEWEQASGEPITMAFAGF